LRLGKLNELTKPVARVGSERVNLRSPLAK